jgi:tRNA(fMet)-specific endonuclease VapC
MVEPRLLDTDTLSFSLKRREPVVRRARALATQGERVALNVISCYEVMRGLKHAGATTLMERLERLLKTSPMYTLDLPAARIAADIHAQLRSAGTPIEDADLLIAAIALGNNAILVTNNTVHYSRIPGLRLENWTEQSP